MGTVYADTSGNAANSGSTDDTSPITGSAATVAASVVTLDGSPNLSGLITSGAAQSSINIAGATNANTTIFWITAFDDTLKTVTVSVAPTGVTTNAWRIGGRYLWPSGAGVNVVEGALRAGDILQFNQTPATKSVTYLTCRQAGDATGGFVTVRGKVGVRPVLETTVGVACITGGQNGWYFQNLELKRGGTSGNVMTSMSNGTIVENIKISAAPTAGHGISGSNVSIRVINCEITGCGGDGINTAPTASAVQIIGNYIHGNTGNGINVTSANPNILIQSNIISGNTGRGVILGGASTVQTATSIIDANVFYNNTDSGLEVTDADTPVILTNNIFQCTGTPFNVKWAAGSAELVSYHAYNVFYISAGSNNLSGLTANSTESTSNPNLTNPGSADFSINSTSSAAGVGFPGTILGVASVGHLDIGAIQSAAGGGGFIIGS